MNHHHHHILHFFKKSNTRKPVTKKQKVPILKTLYFPLACDEYFQWGYSKIDLCIHLASFERWGSRIRKILVKLFSHKNKMKWEAMFYTKSHF